MPALDSTPPPAAVPLRRDATAAEADLALRRSLAALDRDRRSAILWFAEIMERRLYRELGHPTIEVYAHEALGFSPSRTRQFIALACRLRRLPRLRAAVAEGRLGWTAAQEIGRVITPASEQHWVERAQTVPRARLRADIAQAKAQARRARSATATGQMALPEQAAPAAPDPGDPPVTVVLQLDSLQYARFEALGEAAKKARAVAADASRAEVVLAGLAALTENPQHVRRRTSSGLSAVQVIVQRCPDCAAAHVQTGRGPRRLGAPDADALRCDAVERDRRGHNRSTVPPALRRRALDRDGHRCTTPGCTASRFLEVHHVRPRAEGGRNTLENLLTLCHRCHRARHG